MTSLTRTWQSSPPGFVTDPISGRDVAAFVAAVDAESMQGAAEALGLTQSAVSKRIQALERRTGAQLLLRDRRGVWPTAAGRALYPKAQAALKALGEAAMVVAETTNTFAHSIRISASHTIGQFLLPEWLGNFRAMREESDFRSEIHIVNSPTVLANLRNGIVDIGFVEGTDTLQGLESLTLTWDELVVVVGPKHRWASRRSLRPQELANDGQYFTRERDSGTRAIATHALAEHDIELHPVLETASILGLKEAVRESGFTVLSALTVQPEVERGALHALTVDGVNLRRPLRAVRRPGHHTAAARELWRFLRLEATKPT